MTAALADEYAAMPGKPFMPMMELMFTIDPA